VVMASHSHLHQSPRSRVKKSERSAARLLRGRGPLVSFRSPQKNEGNRAPTGAGAEAPHPMVRLASGPISGSPEMTGQ